MATNPENPHRTLGNGRGVPPGRRATRRSSVIRIPIDLRRPPNRGGESLSDWSHLTIDRVRQVEALADLFAMGLLSIDEFERFKADIAPR